MCVFLNQNGLTVLWARLLIDLIDNTLRWTTGQSLALQCLVLIITMKICARAQPWPGDYESGD